MRKYSQGLMILITLLVIISFVWFYNGSRSASPRVAGVKYVAKIYDRPLSQQEADSDARKLSIAGALQLVDLENALVGRAMSQGEALTNFILNSQVVRHEADRLQIKP
ncbi:MAG: hypothetical protein WCD79_08890, partial [Chthoniobacteraceae bacterium]